MLLLCYFFKLLALQVTVAATTGEESPGSPAPMLRPPPILDTDDEFVGASVINSAVDCCVC